MKNLILSCLGAALVASTAGAVTTTITFDDVPSGTLINTHYPGIVFTNPVAANMNIFARNPGSFWPSATNVVTITTNPAAPPFFDSSAGAVDAHFSTPVRTISIDARPVGPVDGNLTPLVLRPYLQAFDAAGNYLGQTVYYQGPLPTNCCNDVGPTETLTITVPAGNIGIARFSSQQPGTNGTSPRTYGLFDNLRSDNGWYSLNVNSVGAGTVSTTPFPGPYYYGTVVTLGANPQTGWAFSAWSGSSNSVANPLYLVMNGDKNITATFVQIPQTGPNFVVTTTDDHDDGVAGTVDCTLREAINAANANVNSNTITFAANVTGEIALRLGELAVTHDVAIAGPGAATLAVNGNGTNRVFDIQGGTVLISGLTIKNGGVTGTPGLIGAQNSTGGTGGSGLGGCVYNQATLTVSNCWIRDGIARGGVGGPGGPDTFDSQAGMGGTGGPGAGGGVYNSGTLTMVKSTLSANTAVGGAGGAGGNGYAYFYGDGSIGGQGGGGSGGGLANAGVLVLRNCTFSGNTANGGNGGPGGYSAPSQGDGGGGGNGGNGSGGAVANLQNLNMASCTLSPNYASGGRGGLGANGAGADGAPGSGGTSSGAGLLSTTTLDVVQNSIIAGSSGPDCSGTFASQGYNLIGDATGASGFTAVGDQTGTTASPILPLLGPLQFNGGSVPTMALLLGSPAVDKGKSAGLLTDERGFVRPVDFSSVANAVGGDGSDIGAFELAMPALNITRSGSSAVVLSWSATETGFTLESTPALTSPPVWSPVGGTPVIVGGEYRVTNSTTPVRMFYRLRKP